MTKEYKGFVFISNFPNASTPSPPQQTHLIIFQYLWVYKRAELIQKIRENHSLTQTQRRGGERDKSWRPKEEIQNRTTHLYIQKGKNIGFDIYIWTIEPLISTVSAYKASLRAYKEQCHMSHLFIYIYSIYIYIYIERER